MTKSVKLKKTPVNYRKPVNMKISDANLHMVKDCTVFQINSYASLSEHVQTNSCPQTDGRADSNISLYLVWWGIMNANTNFMDSQLIISHLDRSFKEAELLVSQPYQLTNFFYVSAHKKIKYSDSSIPRLESGSKIPQSKSLNNDFHNNMFKKKYYLMRKENTNPMKHYLN